MNDRILLRSLLWIAVSSVAAGCQTPYRSEQGAVVGGLGGAGLGALVGNAVGHTGAGAAIGAGVGALSGAAIGGSLDEIEARNRAEIEARLGHPVGPGAVTSQDVIAMTHAGVSEDVIINHVHVHGVVAPLQSGDLIALSQQGVSPRVIQAMQTPPVMAGGPMVMQPGGPPVVVPAWGPPPPYYYYGGYYGPYWRPYYRRPPPTVSFGVGFGR